MTKTALLDLYADEIAKVRGLHAGTRETSFYPALSNLFDAIGEGLDPPVLCLNHVSGKRAGIPDFGLFERARTRRGETPEWREPGKRAIERRPADPGRAGARAKGCKEARKIARRRPGGRGADTTRGG